MDDKQERTGFGLSYDGIAGFVFDTCVQRQQERVEENLTGALETDAVLVALEAALFASQTKSMPLWR